MQSIQNYKWVRNYLTKDRENFSGSNLYMSSGTEVLPSISYNSTEMEITLGEGVYRTYLTNNFTGMLKRYTVQETVISVIDNQKYYICVSYNDGEPIAYAVTDLSLTNDSDVLVVYTVFTEGTELDVLNWGTEAIGLVNKLNERFIDTDRYGIVYGFELSSDNSVITCSGGQFYLGTNKIDKDECISNVDSCELLYRDGAGGWLSSDVTVFPNTKYDNDSGALVDLTDGEYGIVWVWRSAGTDKEIYIIMGQDSYTNLEIAQGANIPSDLPEKVPLGAIFLGRLIFLKGATTALAESAFTNVFNTSSPTQHNSLLGIQGGIVGEYYHLNLIEHSGLITTIFNSTVSKIIGNTDVETTFIGSGVGSVTIPANRLAVGTKIKCTAKVKLSTGSAQSAVIRVKLDGATIYTSSAGNLPNGLNEAYAELEFELVVRSIGVSGTVIGSGRTFVAPDSGIGDPVMRGMVIPSPITVDTTVANDFDLTYQWTNADPENILNVEILTLEITR